MFYFAYGSNMLRERLVARVGETNQLGCAYLSRYRLSFHKRSNDGSGKCAVVDSGDVYDGVWGVLFELSLQQKLSLDRYEGMGYQVQEVVTTQNNFVINAFTYVCLHEWTDTSCLPYSWYKALVLAGALQSGLPQPYLEDIQRVSSRQDPDRKRTEVHSALVSDSGYAQLIRKVDGDTPRLA